MSDDFENEGGGRGPRAMGRAPVAVRSSGVSKGNEMMAIDTRPSERTPNPERLFSMPTRVALLVAVGIIAWFERERIFEFLEEMRSDEEA